MTTRPWLAVALAFAIGVGTQASAADVTPSPEFARALAQSAYVYIATERKDGSFGTPAEIWFMWDQGAVWVASPPTSWRAKRIKVGRTKARIAAGSKDGPTIAATGAFVRDPAAYDRLFATFAKKYPDGWPKYEVKFRDGLKDGSRVMIRYQPAAPPALPAASTSPTTQPQAK